MDGFIMNKMIIEVPFIDTIDQYLTITDGTIYEDNGVQFPLLYPKMVHRSLVEANDYNPNYVAKDKMRLLKTSIIENGFCFGIVAIFDPEKRKFIIVDGDHRNKITEKNWLALTYKPLIILRHNMQKRLAATMQFNKARGVHRIEGNAELVQRMVQAGAEDITICKTLGIDADEMLRLKRLQKIAMIYKDREYSKSWSIDDEGK